MIQLNLCVFSVVVVAAADWISILSTIVGMDEWVGNFNGNCQSSVYLWMCCVCVVCVWFFCICICDSLEIVYILLFMAETYYILFPVIVYCCFILFCLFFSLENLIQFPMYTWLVYYLVSKLPRRLLYTKMRTIV